MILNLLNFGKFKNKKFDISENITLFYGKNEAGKTTIFDSLLLAFSINDKKSAAHIKTIKARYGDDVNFNTIPEIDKSIKMYPQAYQNIYAIRQSEIIFDINDSKKTDKDWQQAIKMKMFSSDIDINKLIDDVRGEHSGRAENSQPKIIERLKNKFYELELVVKNLYTKRDSIKYKIDDLSGYKKEIDELEKKLASMQAKLKQKKEIIDLDKNSLTLKREKNILKDLEKFFRLKSKSVLYAPFKEDKTQELNLLDERIKESEIRLEYLRGKLEGNAKKDTKSSIDFESLRIRLENSIDKIDNNTKNNNKSQTSKLPFVVITLMVTVLSLLLSYLFKTFIWLFAIIPTLIVPIVVFMIPSKKEFSAKEETEFIDEIKKSFPELKIEANNLNRLRDILLKEIGKISGELEEDNDTEEENASLKYENEISDTKDVLADYNSSLKEILLACDVSTINEYMRKREIYISETKEMDIIEESIKNSAHQANIDDLDEYYAYIKRRIDALENESTVNREATDIEIALKEREYDNFLSEYNAVKEEYSNCKLRHSKTEGEIESSNDLHVDIIEKESLLAGIKISIKDEENKKEALMLLENILFKLNKKNDEVFDKLASNSKVLYSHITQNSEEDDSVSMTGFNSDKIFVKDKENSLRSVDNLSSATKDAMYLSMRLAVLHEIHEDGRIIILDDPFITFDRDRVNYSISFLHAFSMKENIPIVLFTKDEYIVDIMKDIDNSSKIHYLP